MIAPIALAVHLDAVSPVLRPAPRSAERAARYVRLRLDLTMLGVPGRGEIVVDRSSGAFVRRFDAGPVSERDGWDGSTAWHADATGMARVESNPDERAAIISWSRLFAPAGGTAPPPAASQPPDAVVERDVVSSVTLHVGPWTERIAFERYRTENGFVAPSQISDESASGTWTARVVAVETPRSLPPSAFAPPPPPDDASLHGVTTIPMIGGTGYPLVAVSVDGGPPLRFIVDTGGQNVITAQAARRAHLDVVGAGTVTGVGTALQPTAFTSVRSLRIGGAELRDQPFYVLDLGDAPIDGLVGYELLARFAARIDLAHARIELARDARDLGPAGTVVRMTLDNRQPQVEGALDGIPGMMTIDTGSTDAVDVESPFAAAHDLRTRMHASVGGAAGGVGGVAHGVYARAKELRLGAVVIANPAVFLSTERSGGYADPTVAANVGNQVLRHFSLVFDYRNAAIHFEPASASPNRS